MSDVQGPSGQSESSGGENVVLFPTEKSAAFIEKRQTMHLEDILSEVEKQLHQQNIEIDSRVSWEILGDELLQADIDGLEASGLLELLRGQTSLLKEVGQRMDYMLREIDSFLPRR